MTTAALVPAGAVLPAQALAAGELAAVAVAAELVDRVVAVLPRLAELRQREQLLAAAWLLSLRSARTRRAYFADFCA